MANRLFEFNNTVVNGVVFIDPLFINHQAAFRQYPTPKKADGMTYTWNRANYSQTRVNHLVNPNPSCTDNCAPRVPVDTKISVETSFPSFMSYEEKSAEWDAWYANLPYVKERMLSGRMIGLDTPLIAAVIP